MFLSLSPPPFLSLKPIKLYLKTKQSCRRNKNQVAIVLFVSAASPNQGFFKMPLCYGRKCPQVFFSPLLLLLFHFSGTLAVTFGDKFVPGECWIYSASPPREDYKWGTSGESVKHILCKRGKRKGRKVSVEWCRATISSSQASKEKWHETNSVLIMTYLQNETKGQQEKEINAKALPE